MTRAAAVPAAEEHLGVPKQERAQMGTKRKMQGEQQVSPCSSARGPSFFKVMLGNFKRSLRVPPSFARHIMGKAHCKFTLQSSISSRSWNVEVKRIDNDLFFHNGWRMFLKDHMIDMGDFLVFEYDGNLGFTVHMYGSDGCKKEIFSSDNKGKLPVKGVAELVIHPQEQLCTKSNKKLVVLGEPEPLRRGSLPPIIVGSEKALEAALSFKPKNPYFVATWRLSRAYYMTIPSALVREFDFGRKKHTMLRDYLGRLWPVEVITQGDGRVQFGNGWGSFSSGNFLTIGDACLFEFLQKGDIIQTHIFHMEKRSGKVIKRCGTLASKGRRLVAARRLVTSSQRQRVLEMAHSFVPVHSHYILSWRWSFAHNITIPTSFVRKHKLRSKRSVSLHDPCGRAWPVGVRCREDGRVDLGTGMGPFFRGNNMEDGDTCAFEFAKGGGDVVKVHIFRLNDSESLQGDGPGT